MDAHGGNVYAASRATGRPITRLIDFSASINPLEPSRLTRRAAEAALARVAHYPDPDCLELRGALARRWGLEPAQILIGNGASELIHLVPQAVTVRHALVVGPTFSEYARAITTRGGRVLRVEARRDEAYRPPVKAVHDILLRSHHKQQSRDRIDTLVLCNPNSPTGQVLEATAVVDLVEVAARVGALVVVDEAFVDFCEEHSVVRQVGRLANLVVIRSFTKLHALPGLRVGAAAAAAPFITRLRDRQPPWSVNGVAQAAALAAVGDLAHLRRSRVYLERARTRFISRLRAIPGLTVWPSATNFVLVELPAPCSAVRVAEGLLRQGLVIRDCSAIPGLNPRIVRVAVRTEKDNHRLVDELRAAVAGDRAEAR